MVVHYQHSFFTPWSLLWGVLAVLLAYGLHVLWLWYRQHERPHVKALSHSHWHIIVGIIVALITGALIGVTITKGLGLIRNTNLHVRPNAALVKAGAGAPYSYSLSRYLPDTVLDQGNTNACVAFAMTMERWMQDNIRGENVPDVFSGFYTYWWVTGGSNVGTSIDSEANSIISHGVTLLGNQPYFGAPSQSAINAAVESGGSYRYLFYNFSGQDSLDSIKAEIANNIPVLLLIQVNSGFENSFNGNSYTDNTGGFVGNHAVVAYAYDGNNFYIRNSWGSGFGNSGNIELTNYAMSNSVIGAAVVSDSPYIAWPRYVAPTPVAPIPTPRPTPVPTPKASYTVKQNAHFRSKPVLSSVTNYVVRKGWKLIDLKHQTASWRYVRTLSGRVGWILKSNLCPVRGCTVRVKAKPHGLVYTTIRNISLHKTPNAQKPGVFLVRKGQKVTYLKKFTTHWIFVVYLHRVGWLPKNTLR